MAHHKVSSYSHAKSLCETYMQENARFIILYGRGGNGKSHLIKELSENHDLIFSDYVNGNIEKEKYVVLNEYNDIQELENVAKNRTPTKFILHLNDSEELSYFQDCLWPVIVIDMNALKFGRAFQDI
jgi:hypothetical protein